MNHFLFLLALLSLSQSANLVRLAGAPVEVIGFWRLLGAAVFLGTFLKIRYPERPLFRLPKHDNLWIFLSAFFFFLHLWTFTFAAQNTQIASAMILFATNPLFTAFKTLFIFKEVLSPQEKKRLALAYVLAFSGIIFLVAHKFDFGQSQTLGNISALLSAITYSAYLLSSRKARQSVSSLQFSWLNYLWTALFFFLAGSLAARPWLELSSQGVISIIALIAFPTFLGHFLFTHLLKHLNVNWMSCGKLIEPALSAVVAFALFGERLTHESAIAFVLTGAAVLILFWPTQKSETKTSN